MEKKFLVLSYCDKTKKVLIDGGITIQMIKNHAKIKFDLAGDFYMKYFDKDVDEWIDLDDIENIAEERVIKIKFIKKCQLATPAPATKTVDQDKKEESIQIDTTNEIGAVNRKVNTVTPEKSTKREKSNYVTETKKLGLQKPWPRIYAFPTSTTPRSLLIKLEGKQTLEKSDISKLMDTVYHDVSQYENGVYPSSDMYEQIIDAMLTEYPYLAKDFGIPLQSVRVYWKEKLKYKWGNERKIKDKDLPEVQAKRRKVNVDQVNDNADQSIVNLTWSMANYLPPDLESEDKKSLTLHKEWLKREFFKTDQDERLVDLKMSLTFSERRKQVVSENKSITDILRDYPFLHSRRQLLIEFERLGPSTQVKELEELFFNGLDIYKDAIISITKGNFLQEIIEEIPTQRVESQRKYTSQCAAVLSLFVLFREKVESVLKFNPDQDPGASVVLFVSDKILTHGQDQFSLKIEGNEIFSCDTFLELITGFIATIYCFNLVYPKQIEKTLTFFQNVILNLKDDDKIDKRIVSVLTEINREKSKK